MTETVTAPTGTFSIDMTNFDYTEATAQSAVPTVPVARPEPASGPDHTPEVAPDGRPGPRPQPPMQIREVFRWHEQIGARGRKAEVDMFGLAAYSLSYSVRQIEFEAPRPGWTQYLPIGTMTHFVLTRRWKAHKGGRLVVLRFVGYKARLTDDGRIQVGGPGNCVCGYDAKYAPFEGASPGGVILDARKRTTLRMALDLDAGTEVTAAGAVSPSIRLEAPQYLAGFAKGVPVDIEDTPAVRRAVLDACRPSYDGPVPECCKSRGGTVKEVVRLPDHNKTFVTYTDDGVAEELPHAAVLRPYVVAGAVLAKGAVVADMAPRAVYGTWEQLRRAVGEDTLGQLQRAVVASLDVPYQGMRLRDVRFCPGQLLDARQVFEVPPLLDETGRSAIQVVREGGHGRNGLQFTEGPIDVDLDAVRPGWERKFA